ncbi:MAG: ATP-dependent RNA helicase DbpA [Candidatus Omnitrophica bacterium]|nr:ATP-dependent RNA helicase DbpA [Candidatus Omnitrophota bacterium]MBU1996665.1 ATP-dependent RNA helicase DbpA [Candidatus Omnitrophota bacterium]MBU4334425.1 ATP-dependent RNA helicase DbpA [Candidatus Omnitrophota bacterium]
MEGSAKDFKSVGLNDEMLDNLKSLGYLKMTPIQEKGLPLILSDQDFIGQANTGSGKTAAFALGILSKLDVTNCSPQALVIVPTRELAEQVANEIRMLARFRSNIKVLTMSGGLEEHLKIKSLKQGAHIIVGTPGRIIKLFETGMLVANDIKILVLDEADRLLEMGSIEEINRIASFTPLNRQTMLFSATFPNGIKKLSASIQEDPAQVTIDSQHQINTIEQLFFKVDGHKNDALLRVLRQYNPESCIIFCNSREICKKVAAYLGSKNMVVLQIHSDLEQPERTLFLLKFDNKSCRILVATDLASRGLDVKDVAAIINYDLPCNHELYVHRIGRTGRAGKKGLALSLYTENDCTILENISDYLKLECQTIELNDLEKLRQNAIRPCMSTIYITGGRKDNIRPGDILGALTREAGLKSEDVGKIHVLEVNSYVAIANDKIEHAIEHLNLGKIKGKKFRVGKA